MTTRNGISVEYVRSNEVYCIYRVWGIENEKELNEPVYRSELRQNGSNEESVLSDIVD